MAGPKYSADSLERALQAKLGNNKLSDCKTKFIATSYDWSTDRPVYFKSYEISSQNKNYIVIGYDSPILLWQICRASSAAQTYFPAFQYNGMVLIDGGNVGDNAPDVLVISEATSFSDITNIKMLSIGAGDTLWRESPSSMISPSLARAGIETINIVFSAGESSAVYKASRLLKDNYFRISPNLGNGYDIDDTSPNTLSALQLAGNLAVNSNSELLVKSIS